MGWQFKKRDGYSYGNALKVLSVDEEYDLIAVAVCDRCRSRSYQKNQGPDPFSRFHENNFFDVIHCECEKCGHKRDFVFDVSEFPGFKKIIERAKREGPGALQRYGEEYNRMNQPISGSCPQCETPFILRPGQLVKGVPCTQCGVILQFGK